MVYAATMVDPRPTVWIGHIFLPVSEPRRSHDFYVALGMRSVEVADDFAIAELRGGTHLLLAPGEATGGDAPFDLMVEDVPATHARYIDAGLDVTAVSRSVHHPQVFVVCDPDGYKVPVYDDHTVGVV